MITCGANSPKFVILDDFDPDPGFCPICFADVGQHCSVFDGESGFGVELGSKVHIERMIDGETNE